MPRMAEPADGADVVPLPGEVLNLAHLRLFLAVARVGTVSGAAERLHTSQPALSRQIAALEDACGERLFERLPRGVRLTPAGEVTLRHAERIFALADELSAALGEFKGLRVGRLLVGASSTPAEYVLPALLVTYRERYPGIAVRLVTGNTAAIVDHIARHALDIGVIGSLPPQPMDGVRFAPLAEDELVVVAAPGHPFLVRGTPVRPRALTRATLIAREAGSATRATAERYAATLGVRLTPALELGSTEAVKRAVMGGSGYAILSRHALTSELAAGHLAIVPVTGWDCRRLLYLVQRAAHVSSRAERAFLGMLACWPTVGHPGETEAATCTFASARTRSNSAVPAGEAHRPAPTAEPLRVLPGTGALPGDDSPTPARSRTLGATG
jgi:DNA-binding transcriptional LysR family regulator